jgi:DNA repair photolyase
VPRLVSNPPNPWASSHVEWLEEPPSAPLQILEERARSILSENESPDIPFRFSVNPYRGCMHACAYCYARPTHEYLGLGAGTDFDRTIVVKTNAPALLRQALAKRSWRGDRIVFSGNTDAYQPLEASYGLTRACLEACAAASNPASVITKNALVARDAALLGRLAREAGGRVTLSVPFASEEDARAIEPFASRPRRRFEAMRTLADAGVPAGVAVAPVIPGINDSQIPEVLERARDAGATRAFLTLVRLPKSVLPVFDERLEAAYPGRAEKVRALLRGERHGGMNTSTFGARMRGASPRWALVERLFETTCRKLGLSTGEDSEGEPVTFRKRPVQGTLF